MNAHGEWEEAREPSARALFVDGAPPLSDETAQAVVELLWAMADAVDAEYAAAIEACRERSMPPRTYPLPESPWLRRDAARQLTLDLGEDDDF